ncbi:MAG: TonB family protein [Thermoanaerobaculia bacterium]
MFEQSPTWSRYKPPTRRIIGVHLGHVPSLEDEGREDRSNLRWAIAAALGVHLLLAFLVIPGHLFDPRAAAPERPVFVVRPVRFEPPRAQPRESPPPPQEKRRVIPIPDPTPQEPEPIRQAEVEAPEFDPRASEASLVESFGIPDGPPAPPGPRAFQVGGEVSPPVKVFAPTPPYTEDARKARIQGVVILEAIIDALGNVTDVQVLKGLPQGLSDSAVEAARSWRFEPARRNGEPVPVYFTLTIRFSLQ